MSNLSIFDIVNFNIFDTEVTAKTARSYGKLFDNKALSDVQIKLRDDQRISGHKQILAQKSEWFFRAFNGEFSVASSNEICLDDDDDDPKAIRAMLQYIYDSNYAIYLSSEDLMYYVDVFGSADKYDVPSLRVLVVSKFTMLMGQKLPSSQQEVCTVIQRLCGADAVSYADSSLQKSAASFCSRHLLRLTKLDAFVSMLEECGPFAARLFATFLRDKEIINTLRCQRCKATSTKHKHIQQSSNSRFCFTCGTSESNRVGSMESLLSYSFIEL